VQVAVGRDSFPALATSSQMATDAIRARPTAASEEAGHGRITSGVRTPTTIARPASVRIVAALAVVAALWWGQVILIPIVLSVLISYALEPFVVRLESCCLPRSAAVPLLLMILVASTGAGAYVLRGEATAFVNRLPAAAHTVAQAVQSATRGAPGTVAKVQQAARELETAANTATTAKAGDGVTSVRIEEPAFKWSDWFWQGSHGALELAGQMFVVLCLVYYLLVAGDLYKRKLVRIIPRLSDKKITVQILAEIDRQIGRFLLARAMISLIVGVLVWVAFRMMAVDDPGVWGVLSAVLFAIPIVGPTVVVVGAAIAAFVQFGSLGMTAAVGGIGVAIAALEGNVLTPWLLSRVGEMNAVAVFVSLLFWGWIWGTWGLLLAVPMTAAAKAVCERIPDFRAVAELLKG
jgi:predicted PurR-regulated permease PerM